MKTILLSLYLLIANISYAQRDPITPDPINVDGYRGRDGDKKGSGAADKDYGGKDKDKSDKTTVDVGKQTTSESITNEVGALLQDYYGKDFFSSFFSPSFIIPGDAMETELIEKLYELELKAGKENRPADAKFLKDLGSNIRNKSSVKYFFTPPLGSNKLAVHLFEPLILHNVSVRTSGSIYTGMQITVPGNIFNAQGKQAELIVRFYFENGNSLKANIDESFYKDVKNLVVVGSGVMPIINNPANVGRGSLLIPYYALNLIPTNGQKQYIIKTKAFMYIDNKEVSTSDFTSMLISY